MKSFIGLSTNNYMTYLYAYDSVVNNNMCMELENSNLIVVTDTNCTMIQDTTNNFFQLNSDFSITISDSGSNIYRKTPFVGNLLPNIN